MNIKGFAETNTKIKFQNDVDAAEKHLKTLKIKTRYKHTQIKVRRNRSQGAQKKYFNFIVTDNWSGVLWNLSFFVTNLQKSIIRD